MSAVHPCGPERELPLCLEQACLGCARALRAVLREVEFLALAVQSKPVGGLLETLTKQLRPDADAGHAAAELAVVVLAAPHFPDTSHDALSALWKVLLQPVLEEWIDLPGQPEHDAEGRGCARRPSSLQDALEFRFVEKGNHGRDAHANGYASASQGFDGAQPAFGRCRPWLHHASQGGIQRGDRDVDGRETSGCHRRDQVEIPLDACRLRDDRERMSMVLQDFDDRARDAELALHGLVGIACRSDVQQLGLVPTARQRLAQAVGRIDLRDDPGLEIEAGRQVEVAVGRSRVAIDAARPYLIEKD